MGDTELARGAPGTGQCSHWDGKQVHKEPIEESIAMETAQKSLGMRKGPGKQESSELGWDHPVGWAWKTAGLLR